MTPNFNMQLGGFKPATFRFPRRQSAPPPQSFVAPVWTCLHQIQNKKKIIEWLYVSFMFDATFGWMCVCVCVCERERKCFLFFFLKSLQATWVTLWSTRATGGCRGISHDLVGFQHWKLSSFGYTLPLHTHTHTHTHTLDTHTLDTHTLDIDSEEEKKN